MSGIDRTQTLRIDCPTCKGKGYTESPQGQDMCSDCEGSGMREKEVGYKFETKGVWSKSEVAHEFGLRADEIVDTGHSDGEE